MKTNAHKFDLRLRVVQYAREHGVKPAAREFQTTPKTVRKWLQRYRQERLAGLNELPRIPLTCPHKTPPAVERRIVELRRQYPFMGAKRLKFMFDLAPSHVAIARILCEHDLVHKRRKKHQRKASLREVKKHWKLFGQITADTKELRDIPNYWPPMMTHDLPRIQYTAREIRSGAQFLAYAREKTATNACLFAAILGEHLQACGLDLAGMRFQTDNGSEFIGGRRDDGSRDGFGPTVEAFGAVHKRIPIKAWSYNSDVETVHRTIEDEFFDLESFRSNRDFLRRAATYLAWYNILRPNMNKDYLSPWQIIQRLRPDIRPAVVLLPPLMLDWLAPDYFERDEIRLGGYDVPWHPWRCVMLRSWSPRRAPSPDRKVAGSHATFGCTGELTLAARKTPKTEALQALQ
jgi:transposase-like protein